MGFGSVLRAAPHWFPSHIGRASVSATRGGCYRPPRPPPPPRRPRASGGAFGCPVSGSITPTPGMKVCLFVFAARENRNTAITTTTTMTMIAATGLTLFFTRCHLLSQATAHHAGALRGPALPCLPQRANFPAASILPSALGRYAEPSAASGQLSPILRPAICASGPRPPQRQWNRPLHCPARRTIPRAHVGVNPRRPSESPTLPSLIGERQMIRGKRSRRRSRANASSHSRPRVSQESLPPVRTWCCQSGGKRASRANHRKAEERAEEKMQRRRCRLGVALGRHHGCDGVLKLLLGHGPLSVFRQDHTCRQIRAPSPNPSRPALPVTRVWV